MVGKNEYKHDENNITKHECAVFTNNTFEQTSKQVPGLMIHDIRVTA